MAQRVSTTPPAPRRVQSSKSFTLVLAQLRVEWGAPTANRRRALQRIAQAARAGAQMVLLPEVMDLGWTFPQARALAQPVPHGAFCAALRRAARRHRIYICAGLTEAAGDRVYNAAVLIPPSGKVLLHHRKLNELAIGHNIYDQGDRLGVVETPLGTLGLMICADARAEGECIARTLGLMGADIVLSPSAWAVPPGWNSARWRDGGEWQQCYGKVARDFELWIAGCSNVGPICGGAWKNYSCIGCSLVVDSSGHSAARGDGWRVYRARRRARR